MKFLVPGSYWFCAICIQDAKHLVRACGKRRPSGPSAAIKRRKNASITGSKRTAVNMAMRKRATHDLGAARRHVFAVSSPES